MFVVEQFDGGYIDRIYVGILFLMITYMNKNQRKLTLYWSSDPVNLTLILKKYSNL